MINLPHIYVKLLIVMSKNTIHTTKTQNHGNTGFTLVELLVTITILAIGVLAVASMISRSTIQDARSYHTTRASMVLEKFFEDTARTQYDVGDFNNLNSTSFNSTVDSVEFNTNCTIRNDFPLDGCKQMNCTVTWNNNGLLARTTYVYTYARKY